MNRLRKLLVRSRRNLFSALGGNNLSSKLGEGYDFAELREYRIGDDLRKIDWVISAKLGTPYVKLFHEERELNVAVAAVLPGSAVFGEKREVMAETAALLGHSALGNGDRFGGFLYADRLYAEFPSGKKKGSVPALAEAILEFDPVGKETAWPEVGRFLFRRLRRRSLVFVLGDFYGPVGFGPAAKKHEIIAVIIRDRREENPETAGGGSWIDPVSGAQREGSMGKKSVERYREMIARNDREMMEVFHREGVRAFKLYTDQVPLIQLARFFGRG